MSEPTQRNKIDSGNNNSRLFENIKLQKEIERLKNLNLAYQSQIKSLITLQKKHEHEIEKLSRVKSKFLANMSHEIRTPMNAILGLIASLKETRLDSEQKDYVAFVYKAGESLLDLVNDILDISKIESKEIILNLETVNLEDLLNSIIDVQRFSAQSKGLELLLKIDPEVPKGFYVDPLRFRQIIVNIISNGIKFTELGKVEFEIGYLGLVQNNHHILFTVKDSGIGISKSDQEKIFTNFNQIDDSDSKLFGGSGKGLFIAQSLAKLMGTKIKVCSRLGKGSEFSFNLKLQEANIDQFRGRVLIVDDDEMVGESLRECLKDSGIYVNYANSVANALELVRKKRFDAVISDYDMPYWTGFDFVNELRKMKVMVPFILMTGCRSDLVRERANEECVFEYLEKPVLFPKLEEVVKRAVNVGKSYEPSNVYTNEQLNNLSILIAEDAFDNRKLLEIYMRDFPYKLDFAKNGIEAVKKFKENQFDLVLMDIQMPCLDGYEATSLIRSFEKTLELKAIPIIALTAYTQPEEKEKILESGCDAYLSKPVRKIDLIEKILFLTSDKKSS